MGINISGTGDCRKKIGPRHDKNTTKHENKQKKERSISQNLSTHNCCYFKN